MSVASQPINAPLQTEKPKNERTRILLSLTIISGVLFAICVAMWFFYAGMDLEQGQVQRLFYPHMASFFGAFVAYGATVVAGIQYLRTRQARWDRLSVAGVEVGTIFAAITLITGSVWARPIWNTWWTWDPRLTSAAVMVLTYIAYLMLRQGFEKPETKMRFSAVYGILAFSTVIFTLIVIRIRPDTIHPTVVGPSVANQAQGGFAVTSGIGATMGMTIAVWMAFLAPTLMWWRIRLENMMEYAKQRQATLMENS